MDCQNERKILGINFAMHQAWSKKTWDPLSPGFVLNEIYSSKHESPPKSDQWNNEAN